MTNRVVRGLGSLTLAAVLATVTGCSGGSTDPAGPAGPAASGADSAGTDRQVPADGTQPPPLPTTDHSPVISVTSGEGNCAATARTVASDRYAIIVHNSGSQVIAVYIYSGEQVLAAIEEVAPAAEKELDDVALPTGSYDIACRSAGAAGPDFRIPLTVTG